ncbi:MAG: helix-turn-helix transcriptional regulator [Peptococcaceae bacterium]|nr:helix-turn-helix transcriptional regulator [Peptococcaceae bacterium]
MYKNRASNGSNNICGRRVRALRLALVPRVSQRALADLMQLRGIDLDKNAIQRIECGKRFVTDIELKAFAQIFRTTTDDLLSEEEG